MCVCVCVCVWVCGCCIVAFVTLNYMLFALSRRSKRFSKKTDLYGNFFVCVCAVLHTHTHTHTHKHIYKYIYTYISAYNSVNLYVYIYIFLLLGGVRERNLEWVGVGKELLQSEWFLFLLIPSIFLVAKGLIDVNMKYCLFHSRKNHKPQLYIYIYIYIYILSSTDSLFRRITTLRGG